MKFWWTRVETTVAKLKEHKPLCTAYSLVDKYCSKETAVYTTLNFFLQFNLRKKCLLSQTISSFSVSKESLIFHVVTPFSTLVHLKFALSTSCCLFPVSISNNVRVFAPHWKIVFIRQILKENVQKRTLNSTHSFHFVDALNTDPLTQPGQGFSQDVHSKKNF